ncbi:hypothetical protein ACEWY4_000060 [Coilia grayii]|uniref:ribonuclease H n=1 Tax=Coilia grayii TaxID=363190 RepID=A0ABD1KVJ6_9TELE
MFNLEDYISAPTQEALLLITRDELLRVAGHYKVEVRGGISKADLQEKLIGELYDRGLFGEVAKVVPDPPSTPDAGKPISDLPPPVGKAALEWKRLELREKEIEWEREKLEAERQTVREREQREHELRRKDLEFAQALRVKELDIKARESGVFLKSDQFDVTRNIRVVPPFREDEVDKFFAHFERVATTLRWPREVWTMTLQCVFTGKAQEAYSSLTLEDAADYDKVKQAVLRVYSLVPEAYRQKFRAYQKPDGLTYVEFVREKELLFDRWLNSQKVSTFQGLRDLVILEDFLNCLPQLVATHVGEHKDLTPARAAVLADEYVLTHKRVHPASVKSLPRHTSPPKSSKTFKEFLPVAVRSPDKRTSPPLGVPTCAYCQKRGHVLAECYLRKRRNKTPHHPASSNACVSTMPLLQNADAGGHTPAVVTDGDASGVKAELSTTVGAEVVSLVTAAHFDSDGRVPAVEVIEGRMRNSEVLNNLDSFLSHLPQPQRKELAALITVHDDLFPDVPRRTTVICHDIDVGDASPIKQHSYRVNPYKRLIFQKEVKFMLENGIAEPSCSPWSSPCLLVPKSDGSSRFCTDFRRVNALTKPDSYPLPRVDDCVDRLGSAVYVSKIDLLKGYWQVPLADRAKEISAFVTPDHFLQYTCMAFRLRNAPATFQRLINGVLEGVANCEAYLDDLILHSTTWPEHLALLSTVFQRLSAANLSINLAKCEFGQATVVYLGKVVGGGQVRPVQSKVEAILNYPVPSTRRELRRLLGMVGYYRSFCKNFAAIAAPLTDLLSSKVSFAWTQRSQVAFESVKALITTAPVLAAPDFSLPFSLAVDASDLGAGAVLLQSDQHGLEHPVCFYSRKFDKHQRAYSTKEKEALALVLALQRFEVYVGGAIHPVVVYTDHNPLVFLTRMRNCNQRLMRWSVILQGYNLEIKHIRGRDNVVADALSRV